MSCPQTTPLASSMDDANFRALVVAESKGITPSSVREMLQHPAVLRRWMDALVEIKKDVDAQMTEREAKALAFQQECHQNGGKGEWFSYKSGWLQWRATANRFRAGIERRISEVRRIRATNVENHLHNHVWQAIRLIDSGEIEIARGLLLGAVRGDLDGGDAA